MRFLFIFLVLLLLPTASILGQELGRGPLSVPDSSQLTPGIPYPVKPPEGIVIDQPSSPSLFTHFTRLLQRNFSAVSGVASKVFNWRLSGGLTRRPISPPKPSVPPRQVSDAAFSLYTFTNPIQAALRVLANDLPSEERGAQSNSVVVIIKLLSLQADDVISTIFNCGGKIVLEHPGMVTQAAITRAPGADCSVILDTRNGPIEQPLPKSFSPQFNIPRQTS